MALKIEGGQDWLYFDGEYWEPIPSMPHEHLKLEFVYLAPDRSTDAVGIRQNEEGIYVSVYRSHMPGCPSIKVVEFEGDVKLNPEKCPSISYKLGPGEGALHFSYGGMERLIIASS